MKSLSNQKGYALLIVLFTIIIFLSVSAVIMSATLTNSTQEKTVNQQNQAVVAAEMGIKKLHVELQNKINVESRVQREYALSELQKFNEKVNAGTANKNQLPNVEKNIKQQITINMASLANEIFIKYCGNDSEVDKVTFVTNYSSKSTFEIVDEVCEINTGNTYEIHNDTSNVLSNYIIELSNDDLILSGSFDGDSDRSATSKIKFSITYPISDLVISDNDDNLSNPENNQPQPNNPPKFEEMFKDFTGKTLCPVNLAFSQCIAKNTTSLSSMNHSKILFKSPVNFSKNGLTDMKYSSIYSDHPIDLNNVKGLKNGSFYVKGDFITGQFSGIDNLYIQLDGKLNITKNAKGITNSVIYTSREFEVDHLDLSNSSIHTQKLIINKHLNMTGTNNICVRGDVTFTQNNPSLNMSSDSNIYYTGTLRPGEGEKRKFNKIPQKLSLNDFNVKCKIDNPYEDNPVEYKSKLELDRLNETDVEIHYN